MAQGERDYDAERKDAKLDEIPAFIRRGVKSPTQVDLIKEHEATALAAILTVHAEYAAATEVALAEAEAAIIHAQQLRDQKLKVYAKN